ncbi:unnamed protein product, partial [Mesorhabditis belari]|uniref:Uncharacterized protein n=1 Tax=Mesorhabditis belari TaxID=2138241 RepID=A0AAF3J276_9BILA
MAKLLLLVLFFAATIAQDVWYKCEQTDLEIEQKRFNKAIGIDENLTFRNISDLYEATFAVFRQDQLKVCGARQQFAQYLGAKYMDCIDPWTISSFGGLPGYAPIDYAQIWNRLEFACGAGSFISLYSYECVYNATRLPMFSACYQTWRNNRDQFMHIQDYCAATAIYMQCGYDSVVSYGCNTKDDLTPFYLCESIRMGNGRICAGQPNQRCYV